MSNYTLFSQIISQIDRNDFKKLVHELGTDHGSKGFNSWSHMVSMLFCQVAKCTSVRDISFGLQSAYGNLNHLGIKRPPSKSTLSYQNQRRDSELFKRTYFDLLSRLGQHTKGAHRKLRIKSKIHLLDSTVISLCMSMFDWAKYRTTKGAIKLHTVLEYNSELPSYLHLSDGKGADNKIARMIKLPEGSVVVADRYYCEFKLLDIWDSTKVRFVVRHKNNLDYYIKEEREISKTGQKTVLRDSIIELASPKTFEKYPKKLRRVVIWDEENQQEIELLTNDFKWSSATIGELYKARWRVEMFFRDIKQLLHVKTFIGTSENAVRIQIWSAMIAILLMKYLKTIASFNWNLSNLVNSIRINCFSKLDLIKWINDPILPPPEKSEISLTGVQT